MKKLPANTGSLPEVFIAPQTVKRSASELTNAEKFAIQIDSSMGQTKVSLCKKWGLSKHYLETILNEQLDVARGMQGHLRKLAFNLMDTVERINSTIDEKSIKSASLAQRMVSIGIGLDKAIAVSKHLDGTKDPKAPVISYGDRIALEEAVRRRLEDLPIVEEVAVDVEEVEEVQEQEVSQQQELFPGTQGDVDWQNVEERDGRLFKMDRRYHEDVDKDDHDRS
jgi:hypothetical protein